MVKGIDGSSFNPAHNAAAKAGGQEPRKMEAMRGEGRDQARKSQGEDRVSLSRQKAADETYKAAAARAELSPQFTLLRDLVAKTLREQEAHFSIAVNGEQKGIEDLTPEEAQELVAEDGYFGVEQTSQRIVDFAIGLAGNDPDKIDAILEGVERGFQEAEKAFGGILPEISHQTYDAIREKLDDWVAGFEDQQ